MKNNNGKDKPFQNSTVWYWQAPQLKTCSSIFCIKHRHCKNKGQKITWRDSKCNIIDMFSNRVGPLIHPPAEQTHKRQYLFGSEFRRRHFTLAVLTEWNFRWVECPTPAPALASFAASATAKGISVMKMRADVWRLGKKYNHAFAWRLTLE